MFHLCMFILLHIIISRLKYYFRKVEQYTTLYIYMNIIELNIA